jgi:hypothetical protein
MLRRIAIGVSIVACGCQTQSIACPEPSVSATPEKDPLGFWSAAEQPGPNLLSSIKTKSAASRIAGQRGYRLDGARMVARLRTTDRERPEETAEITLPHPDGRVHRYRASETVVMAASLEERYPEIHSYDLVEAQDGTRGSAVWTAHGLNAVFQTRSGAAQIEAMEDGLYRVYLLACVGPMNPEETRRHDFAEQVAEHAEPAIRDTPAPVMPDTSRFAPRRFEIVIATETHYTEHIVRSHGHDPDDMDADTEKDFVFPYMVDLLNQLNFIYSTNLGVTFYYHPAERDWLYTSRVNPWAGSCGVSGLGIASENNSRVQIDTSTLWSGNMPDLATVLIECDGVSDSTHSYSHWRGLCGWFRAESAVLTGVDIGHPNLRYFIAHELAHLLGASHTFAKDHHATNGDRHYEPGCGSTIMGYGGIVGECRDGDQAYENYVGLSAGDYFSAYSIAEMQSFIADKAADGCGVAAHPEVIAARPEVASALPSQARIPARTPFYLRVNVSAAPSYWLGDAPGYRDDTSSFDVAFDQVDDGCVLCNDGTPFAQDTGGDAIVRSRIFRGVRSPSGQTISITRYVPDFADLTAIADPSVSTARPEELLPQTDRMMNFVASVRAQHGYGATTGTAAMRLRVDGGERVGFGFTANPPAASCGDRLELAWNVAGTGDSEEYGARNVRFKLCVKECSNPDNYDVVLADENGSSLFANTGRAEVVVPRLPHDSDAARILIENQAATFFNVTRVDMTYRRCEPEMATAATATTAELAMPR